LPPAGAGGEIVIADKGEPRQGDGSRPARPRGLDHRDWQGNALFGPHVERMGSPKAPHLPWLDLSLDDCETRTRTSGLVIRESPHENANL
jgi:hypothetical protein